ncbi:MAG: Hsp33 family molecular chaperone HslO [Spirochaetales bacterium]|nr:Hsp33 family molecular chaperone HslO [Spirochaetales bacterium]
MKKDNMSIFMLNNGRYRGALLDATDMVRSMREKHETGVIETFALGETYIAAGLLTSMLKGKDRIGIVFECGGPLKGISVEVTAGGDVRGYLQNNPIPLEKIPERLDLSNLFGPGFLSITKYLEDSKQPFTGQVMITYGSIAKDLAYYYTTSENTPTAFNLSVKFDTEGLLIGAGGMYIQKMPSKEGETQDEGEAEGIQDALGGMPSIGISLAEGKTLQNILSENFGKFKPNVIGSRFISFNCSCSRELFESYLCALNSDGKKDILENGPYPVVTLCHNCNTSYKFSKKEIEELFKKNGTVD